MGFGDVLDASFQIYRRAFWQFAIVQAIVAVPVTIAQALLLGDFISGTGTLSFAVVQRHLPWTLITGLLGLVQAAAVGALAEETAHGRPPSVSAAYSRIVQRLPWLIGAGIIGGVVIGALTFVFVLPGIIALIYFAPALFLVTLGREGVFQSLLHSVKLVQGFFWRLVGILVMAGVLVFIVNLFVSLVATVASNPLRNPSSAPTAVIVVTTIANILLSSFPLIALYVQYADLRTRRGEIATD